MANPHRRAHRIKRQRKRVKGWQSRRHRRLAKPHRSAHRNKGAQPRKKPRRKDNLSSPSCLQSQSVALPQLLLGGWGAASAAGASKVAFSVARLSTGRGRGGSLRSLWLRSGSFGTSVRGQRCVSRCATSSGYAAGGLLHRCELFASGAAALIRSQASR